MKFWLVGAGYWGSKVRAELDTIPGVGSVEVIDIKNGQTIDDINTTDPVILATPLWQHAEQVKTLLDRGHDVYVEKPMGENLADIVNIENSLSYQVLMVGHIFLYNPLLHTLKDLIDNGELGTVKHVESRRLNWGIRQTKTTPLLSLAPHDASIIQHLLGDTPVTYASATDLSNNRVPDMVEFGGPQFSCKVSWWWPKRERTVTVVGTHGQAVWDEDRKTIELFNGHIEDMYPNKHLESVVYPYDSVYGSKHTPLHLELRHFVECCWNRENPRTGITSAKRVAAMLDQAAYLLEK